MASVNRTALPPSMSLDLNSAMVITLPFQTPRPLIPLSPEVPPSPMPSLSLDLADISKTQRRVAALLNVRHPKGGLGSAVTQWVPFKRCPVCRKKMDSSKKPHVHTYDESERLDDETSENLINQYVPHRETSGIVIPSIWDGSQTTEGDLLSDLHDPMSSRTDRSVVKLPQIEDDQRSPSLGDGGTKVIHSPSIEKSGTNSSSDTTERNFMTLSIEISQLGQKGAKSTTIFTDLSALGPWTEEDADDNDVDNDNGDADEAGTVHITKSKRKGRRHSTGATPDSGQDGDTDDDVFISRSSSISETASREATRLSTKSRTRLGSGMWCECILNGSSKTECRECFVKGGHERWCRSQTGDCPECGRPIKGIHREKMRSTLLLESSSKTRTDLSYTSHKSGMCSGHQQSIEDQTQTSVSVSKDASKEKRRKKKGKKPDKGDQKSLSIKGEAKPTAKTPSKRYCRVLPGVDPSLPSFDPDIHRQAYLLALSDSRVKKWKNDPWVFHDFTRPNYFSYFSLWKNPKRNFEPETVSQSKSIPQIGIRGREEKLKIKDPMKHILGSLKLSDYYPTGKMFPKKIKEDMNSEL